MRIAVTGTHGSGKTTLIDDFIAAYPGYEHEQEPYWALAQLGTPFADGATSADLEEQLDQSCGMILASTASPDIVYDRCPLDFIAYLEVVAVQEGFEWTPSGKLLGRIEKALGSLDLVVFLPLSRPDEIDVAIELPRLRSKVDARLKAIIRDDELGLLEDGPNIIELRGTRSERLALLGAIPAG
ncbi:AAA family ATPase [Aminobacter sp. MET-1]|uniref:AAA family ATPase n=1 Tax=Aminobacter sp. MET-1 TaxID=2951085 RepID=UPI00226A31C3|nr:AAA family ATPase [Aminobacter sp. MET-1]MCX8567628.1 ATP-binding protein [Aminobacter sp. MET-1]